MFRARVTMLAVAAILAGGCGTLVDETTLGSEPSSSLTVQNLTDLTVCDVHLAASGSTRWGEDRLAWYESIPPGAAYTFRVTQGSWSVRLLDCQGEVLFAERHIAVLGAKRVDFRALEVWRRTRSRHRGIASIERRF